MLVAEIGLRCYYYYQLRAAIDNYTEDDGTRMVVASKIPGLIYTYKPNGISTNSQGYIDFEYEMCKPSDVFRIVVVGDSVAAGQQVQLTESFPKLLERKLNRESTGRKFEVVVLARSGYSTCQELILLENEAFDYDPDLILWSYVLNDPANPLYHASNGDLVLMYRPKVHLAYLLSRAWVGFSDAMAARDGPEEFHRRLHHIYWDQVSEHLGQIGKLCEKNSVACAFVIHPLFEEEREFDQYGFSSLHEKLADIALESKLTPIDLYDAYKDHGSKDLGFSEDPWHPNKLGHELAAEFLYQQLVEQGLLPKESP